MCGSFPIPSLGSVLVGMQPEIDTPPNCLNKDSLATKPEAPRKNISEVAWGCHQGETTLFISPILTFLIPRPIESECHPHPPILLS